MNIQPPHINQFLKKCKTANWAGVFYSAPFQNDFQFLVQDLNLTRDLASDQFIFHPFDHRLIPSVVLCPQYRNEKSVALLETIKADSSYWVLPRLEKQESTSKENYEEQFGNYISAIHSGKCEKAILSTITKINTSDHFNIGEFIFRLRTEYPQSFIYLFSSPITGTWIGATPELFLEWKNHKISTMSLAGTKNKGLGEFIFGNKEKREQEIVTHYINNVFEQFLEEVKLEKPIEFIYGDMSHLVTPISATCKPNFSKQDLSKLCGMLHPTPAVGGSPKEEAKDLIYSVESHSRSYYSGYLGPISDHSAQLVVNLRCMCLSEKNLYVFAGGGITADSDMEAEWAETRLKAQALLKFL